MNSQLHRVMIVLALSSPGFARDARAQDSLALDPSVAHVTTGGSWTGSGVSGWYRIVVLTSGWEHVGSQLYIQWLEENRERRQVTVRVSRRVDQVTPGIFSLGEPTMRCIDSGCSLNVTGTNTHTMERARWTIKLGSPDEYAIITMKP